MLVVVIYMYMITDSHHKHDIYIHVVYTYYLMYEYVSIVQAECEGHIIRYIVHQFTSYMLQMHLFSPPARVMCNA